MTEEDLQSEVSPGTFVVIPAFNESARIEAVLREVRSVCSDVVVVDDGSTDDTYAIARREARYALRHLLNRGQGAALQTGIDFALACGARFIVTFDADGQHRAEDIAALLAPIRGGECDICLGSRFLGEAVDLPLLRRAMLRLGVWFTLLFSGIRLTDAHNGLRAFSRRAAREINIALDGMAHASELIDTVRRSRLSYREIPVHVRYTEYSLAKGQSSRNALRIVFHYLVDKVTR